MENRTFKFRKFFSFIIFSLLITSLAHGEENKPGENPHAMGMMPTPGQFPMPQYGNMNPMMGMMNPMMGMMNPMMGMMNPMMGMMNPMMGMMNPMMGMMNPMMGMMNPMMNPMMGMMSSVPVDAMTNTETLETMMRSMDPKLMIAMMGGTFEQREDDDVPNVLPLASIPGFPTQSRQNWAKNTVGPSISDEAKKNAFQSMMMMSPLSMRDMLGLITHKIPLEEGVTWDDAVESMMLLANEVNFKFAGSSPLSKEIEALSGEPSPRIEIFRFCDALVARKILDFMPEFIVFLPCKIAMIEDSDGKVWIMTLDWDVSWLDYAQNPNSHMSRELRADAKLIRDNIRYIMEGAAAGDL
jgi:hypothetical protein